MFELPHFKNMSIKPDTSYPALKNTVEEGTFVWQVHTQFIDVVAMNNYQSGSGEMLPNCFVRVTMLVEDGAAFFTCTCST